MSPTLWLVFPEHPLATPSANPVNHCHVNLLLYGCLRACIGQLLLMPNAAHVNGKAGVGAAMSIIQWVISLALNLPPTFPVHVPACLNPVTPAAHAVVICSTDESVPDMVRAITRGRLAHAAVESVAGDLTGAVLSSVRPGGTVLLFGGASGATFSASIGDFIFRGVTLKGFWVGPCLKALSHEQRQVVVREAFDLIANGTVTPFTGDKMDLSEFAAALKNQMVENRQGKILLSG
ncbi:unnamed protein product [Closterium sp. NIES-64]|nr:unnamed protein product [Closterium sp. NIES-64]